MTALPQRYCPPQVESFRFPFVTGFTAPFLYILRTGRARASALAGCGAKVGCRARPICVRPSDKWRGGPRRAARRRARRGTWRNPPRRTTDACRRRREGVSAPHLAVARLGGVPGGSTPPRPLDGDPLVLRSPLIDRRARDCFFYPTKVEWICRQLYHAFCRSTGVVL